MDKELLETAGKGKKARGEELEKIELWREHVLLEAGFAPPAARRLARRHDIDLHQAIKLVAQGCPPKTAERILK